MDIPHMVHGDQNQAYWQGILFVAIPELDAGVTRYTCACDICAFKNTFCTRIQCCPNDGRKDMTSVIFQPAEYSVKMSVA